MIAPTKKIIAGFTLIELLISISIFAFMTAFLLAKYGTFNQGILLTNLAYDTALTIRTAQTYGLDVQGTATSTANVLGFNYPYGVHFDLSYPGQFILFIDICGDGIYRTSGASCPSGTPGAGITIANGSGEVISTYTIRSGFTMASICTGLSVASCSSPSSAASVLDITFKRPNPDAIIVPNATVSSPLPSYAKIVFSATTATTSVVVQSTGQIGVSSQ